MSSQISLHTASGLATRKELSGPHRLNSGSRGDIISACSAPTDGAEVVARRLQKVARTHSIHDMSASTSEQQLAGTPRGQSGQTERAGSVRLRDAIVWGYIMQRPDARTKVRSSSSSVVYPKHSHLVIF